ncbi:MAG: phosphoenolpyruvate--protein phosphotransferase [Deferribacteraceae bacterium]|jgi:phosphocarrier protein FPr|nr:phosphoenolpyruvate--protein phosphotransferase [Deferribacteraceae bacterium]
MVGLVLVSHSRRLAKSVAELAMSIADEADMPIAYCGGIGEGGELLGTDAMDIQQAISRVYSKDGVLVLADIGSALLSSRLAIQLLGYNNVKLSGAPLVEGALAAAVQVLAGCSLEQVANEAENALSPKSAEKEGAVEQQLLSSPDALIYRFKVGLQHGLHARPAANLARLLSKFSSTCLIRNATKGSRPVNAKSVNKITLSNITYADEAEISISGDDEKEAFEALIQLVKGSFKPIAADAPIKKELRVITKGVVLGTIVQETNLFNLPEMRKIHNPAAEIQRFERAVAAVSEVIKTSGAALRKEGIIEGADIFDAHLMILNDAELLSEIKSNIAKDMLCAEYTYIKKMTALAGEIRALPNRYIEERAADILDVASLVLSKLSGETEAPPILKGDLILVAREAAPSLFGRWGSRLKGILTESGGETAHASILARALGIAYISGYSIPAENLSGQTAIIDTDVPGVIINPTQELIATYKDKIDRLKKQEDSAAAAGKAAAVTTDGVPITVMANVWDIFSARSAQKAEVDGIGLFRTEFLFFTRQKPSEEEQIDAIEEILNFFPKKPITIRTVDIGGDKRLSWLYQPKEANPFLGIRGIRLCIREKELFRTHLRAVLQASFDRDVKLMIPMISVKSEIIYVKEVLESVHLELEAQGKAHLWPIRTGIMVETPAAALMADELAEVSDFFSIGTNDLIQYIMCAERGSTFDYNLTSPVQPAVLRGIKMIADAACRHGIELSVCGEMAGDADAALVLLGLGVNSLSMNAISIGRVKSAIRSNSISELKKAALAAMHEKDVY